MQTLIVLMATYGLFLIVAGAAFAWLRAGWTDRTRMVVAGVVALVAVGVLIKAGSMLWTDPRPFVVDGRPPMIAHPADNGFPSDHSAMAAVVAGTVLWWRRRLGLALLVLAVLVAASRVAARVHHVPDVTAGLAFGLVAAAVGVIVSGLLVSRSWWPVRDRAAKRSVDGSADGSAAPQTSA
ncbi:phosphatase PAP2 family protein [Intrasporangium oryzae]|uniref:phosphatase PAP2 family protein n=1 Tax=Intrasporangium oryzae TaxID=412687 RepID=UPI0004AEDAFE|nr:phosphatase PAP2 family protein [Intrasporangium oryzae]